jgi:cell wall-associated NlpC family hydrolase
MTNEKAGACVKLAEEKLGDPYVFGAWGDPCTVKIRKQYAGYNPAYKGKIYGACPVLSGEEPDCGYCKWDGHLCYDCRGFTYYILKAAAGISLQGAGATSQYDRADNWEMKGNADKMPNVVCCVFKYRDGKMSHTGLHVGDGMIIHCSTVVKRGAMSDTTWTHYAVPKGLYTREELKEAGAVRMKPTLRSGSSGDAVRELQEDLKEMGFDPGEIDGKFGPKTREAVMAFQLAYSLTADGIVGGVTWQEIEKQQSLRKPKEPGEQDKELDGEKSEEWRVESGDMEKSEEGEKMIRVPEKTIRELVEKLKELLEEGD